MQTLLILVSMMLVTAALPTMPDPSDLALMLDEEEFEDYLDDFLEQEELNWVNLTLVEEGRKARSGCIFRVRSDLGQPQPVYIHRNSLLMPTGNSGEIRINSGEQVGIGCPGPGITIRHPNINANTAFATATCVSGTTISGAGWLRANGHFGGLNCSDHPVSVAQSTNNQCFGDQTVLIRVGFFVNNVFHTWYHSCFNVTRMEVLYVQYEQNARHAVHQIGVDRPPWSDGGFFPGVDINSLYTRYNQSIRIEQIVGQNMINTYINSTHYLSRGHLAAKSDFPLASAQRTTFYFMNAAPQWQNINAGNWNTLELNLRARISAANYNTVIYTGTFGVTQLRDSSNVLRDIFLHEHVNNGNQVPVPLYYYKVAYDAGRRLGTAFVTINNPYYSATEVRNLQFCTDRCRYNNAFNWLQWQPNRIDLGYSFCCNIPDFRQRIAHIPNWNVLGLLT